MPAFAYTLQHLHRRNDERSNGRDAGGHKGRRTTDECTKIRRRPGNDSSQPEGVTEDDGQTNTITEEYDMKIKMIKTKMMRISSGKERTVKISIDGKELEQVGKFCYLGSMITIDAKCHVEIRRRIAMGKDAFYKRKELLRGKLSKNLKKRIIKSMIWSVVLYGLETWTMRKEDCRVGTQVIQCKPLDGRRCSICDDPARRVGQVVVDKN